MRWQNGFHDELIRDGRQRSAALSYVHGNAVKHGFVTEIPDWPWTSLHFQDRVDPMEVWLD
jgi:putative transposase